MNILGTINYNVVMLKFTRSFDLKKKFFNKFSSALFNFIINILQNIIVEF